MRRLNIVWEEIDVSAGGIQNMAYYFTKLLTCYYEVKGLSGPISGNYKLNNVEYCSAQNAKEWLKISRKWIYQNSSRDVINFSFTWWGAINCCFANIKFKTPFFFYCHGNEIYFKYISYKNNGIMKFFRRNAEIFIKKHICRFVMRRATGIFCNSNYTKDLASQIFNSSKYHVVHPGIEYRERNTIHQKNYSILSISRITKQKGLETVIRAMPEILKQIPTIKYVIAGKGPYEKELKRIVEELNLYDNVIFVGHISEEEKSDLIENCDLFVLPSIEIEDSGEVEGFGIVYLEANQYGKYVIGNSYGGVKDAIQDGKTGAILTEHTIDEFAKAVISFYENYDFINSREGVVERVNWAKEHDYNNTLSKIYEIMERSVI